MNNRISLIFFILTIYVNNIYCQQHDSLSFFSVSKDVNFYNNEKFYSLLGYKVFFPEYLGMDFSLNYCSLAVGVSKKISKETFSLIENDMKNGIESEKSYHELDKFNPYRSGAAMYSNKLKSTDIYVITTPSYIFKIVDYPYLMSNKNNVHTAQTSRAVKFTFINFSSPNLPTILFWDENDITFSIVDYKDSLSETELIYLADQIIISNYNEK